jgi:hypothetical protein
MDLWESRYQVKPAPTIQLLITDLSADIHLPNWY